MRGCVQACVYALCTAAVRQESPRIPKGLALFHTLALTIFLCQLLLRPHSCVMRTLMWPSGGQKLMAMTPAAEKSSGFANTLHNQQLRLSPPCTRCGGVNCTERYASQLIILETQICFFWQPQHAARADCLCIASLSKLLVPFVCTKSTQTCCLTANPVKRCKVFKSRFQATGNLLCVASSRL